MCPSKSQLITKFVLVLATQIALTGCWKATPKDDPNNGKSEHDATASFNVVKVDGRAVNPRDDVTSWKIPTAKEFFFSACVVDRVASHGIKGHKFTVEMPETKHQIADLTTDDMGCFQWQETIPYDYFAYRPVYVELRRLIRGQGIHVGFRNVRVAINPWAGERGDRHPPVVYLKSGQVSVSHKVGPEKALQALAGKLDHGAKQLWISGLSTLVSIKDETSGGPNSTGAGVELGVNMRMKARIKVEDLEGNPRFIDLKNGQFAIWTQLIASNVGDQRNQKVLLTPHMVPGNGKIVDETLEANSSTIMTRRVTRGRLELALKVIPMGIESSVKPFEAAYLIGDFDRIVGGSTPFLKPEMYEGQETFSYEKYLASAENFEELKKTQQAMDLEPFIFETATVMFAGIRPGETASSRTVEYFVTTCVRDTITGQRVPFQKFPVSDEAGRELLFRSADGKLNPTMTNQEGCLTWTSSLTHKYYKPEEYYFPKFTIAHPRSGFKKVKELLINPWDAMFRTFGFDRIQFTDEFIASVRNRKKIPSRLFVPRYSYHAIRFRYEIDRFMNLEVRKQILLNLRPEVLRYSGIIGGRKVTESLRDGIYLMKVAIQKDYLDPADKGNVLYAGPDSRGQATTLMKKGRNVKEKFFVTVEQKLVRVNAGEINTNVEFSMQDLRLMRIRSQFLVQLQAVDERLLQAANVLTAESKKNLALLQKGRQISPEDRKSQAQDQREKLQEVLSRIRPKLAQLKEGDLAEFNIGADLESEIIETLKVNDFTVSSAAPVVDLDQLVEADSGLDRRTFVGPVIFLSNAYGDDLRPTDNLDEVRCETNDCGQIKSREAEGRKFKNYYDTSRYFGSVAHLANKHVDDLISDYYKLKLNYLRTMPILSSVYNFIQLNNLDFISLSDEKVSRFDVACQAANYEQCMRPVTDRALPVQQFLTKFNSQSEDLNQKRLVYLGAVPRAYWKDLDLLRPVVARDLENVVYQGKISRALGDRICQMITANASTAVRPGLSSFVVRDFYRDCLRTVALSDGNRPFHVDQKVRVFETGPYTFKGGKQMNLNVGSNFGLQHNESFSTGISANLAELPIIGDLAKMVSPSINPWLKPLSIKVSRDFSRSRSDGTSVSESTYLVMQSANLDIQLTEYERCVVVKLNPAMLAHAARIAQAYAGPSEAPQVGEAIHRGLFICSGKHETKPMAVTESYYYFTQHFTEGDMLDQADLYNHPWLLALRGVRDFSAFLYLIRAQEFTLYSPMTKVVDKPGWPLDQMVDTYRKVLPTFPGIYTILREGEALKDYPFDHDPDSGFQTADEPETR